MGKKANPTMIGGFVVGAITLVVSAIILFGSQRYFGRSDTVIVYFEESVNGLEEGAPVKFKGVDVGQVKNILIQLEEDGDAAYVPVLLNINVPQMGKSKVGFHFHDDNEYHRLIKNGLRASLDFQSYLTGKLYIELDFHPEDIVPKFINKEGAYREIPSVSSELDEIWSQVNYVLKQMGKIDFEGLGRDLTSIARTLNQGLGGLEFKRINDQLLGALESFQNLSNKTIGHMDPLVNDLRDAIKQARGMLSSVTHAADSIGSLIDEDNALGMQLKETLEALEGAGRSVDKLAGFLERNPSALLGGRQ